jgi:hypothetical protein
MSYYLYPPFLVVPEESSFADAWEAFCCKLLNLKEKTDEIYRRHPPEQGIDLYYPTKQIAYQCKSVESGKSGDFNVSKALDSIKSAKSAKAKAAWKEYVLCTNVDITGTAEAKLTEKLPNIIIRPRSYWQNLCEEFSTYVEKNFRLLLTIPQKRVVDTISQAFYANYSDKLKAMLNKNSFEVFLYSNRHDKIYRVPVSPEYKVEDLLHILKWFFGLPGPRTIESEGISVGLSHSIVFEGKKQVFSMSLQEAGIKTGSVITYWTTIIWEEEDTRFNADVIHMITIDTYARRDPRMRAERAMKIFEADIQKAFAQFDKKLGTNRKK